MSGAVRGTELLVLLDPAYEEPASAEETGPPPESVIGGWELGPDGATGRFVPNPHHVPSSPDVPSDPVDAVLRELVAGRSSGDDVLAALAGIHLDVAIGTDARPLVAPAPDGVPCVLTTTAPRHRAAVTATADPAVAAWYGAALAELAAALPDDGVDVLLNPGGPAPFRVTAAAVRSVADGAAGRAAQDGRWRDGRRQDGRRQDGQWT